MAKKKEKAKLLSLSKVVDREELDSVKAFKASEMVDTGEVKQLCAVLYQSDFGCLQRLY